jgi:hypothetical protein
MTLRQAGRLIPELMGSTFARHWYQFWMRTLKCWGVSIASEKQAPIRVIVGLTNTDLSEELQHSLPDRSEIVSVVALA